MSDFCPITIQGACKFCGRRVESSAGCACQRVQIKATTTPVADFECCADWKPQCEQINGPILLQAARSGYRYQYAGKPFVFCPWCGAKRPT